MKSILLAACLAAISFAATPPQFRADTNVVLVNATVLDRQDRPVRGLDRDQFRVFEDKAEQKITYFSEEEVPVSVAVIFDVSGSMRDKISGMRAALDAVLQSANPGDEFSLVTFASEPQGVVRWTQNPEDIHNALQQVSAQGQTSLLDALETGLAYMKTAKNPRKAMLVFSDGGDNHSRSTEREVMQSLEEANVQIYAMDSTEPLVIRARLPEEIAGPDLLERICNHAGGRYFLVDRERTLAPAAEQISRELRSQYIIGYVPAQANDGRFHHVRVEVKAQAGTRKLVVFWRPGYRAPAD